MYVHVERFGKTYTFGVEEGLVPIEHDDDCPDKPKDGEESMPQFEELPEICVMDAVEAVNNLLRCVFPELEGHHLEIVCDNPSDDLDVDHHPGEGGIDLGKH